jgi:hypothetical protein
VRTIRFAPVYVNSQEMRSDRMNSDPIEVNITNAGGINGELSWPVPDSPFSDWLESLFYNPWDNMAARDNDGTADSVITAMTGTTDVVTCLTGTAFVAGQIAKFSGFTAGATTACSNARQVPRRFRCSSAPASDESAPAAAARIKVVGFQGAAGDLVAVADGITSTLLDFTTLGLNCRPMDQDRRHGVPATSSRRRPATAGPASP